MQKILSQFIEEFRSEILEIAEKRALALAGPLSSSVELRKGLPVFFDLLIEYLKASDNQESEKKIVIAASVHGKELMRLNYTLSHVVHTYGAVCQAVTEFAQLRQESISPAEFNGLNLCLDIAIASAVSEFQFKTAQATEDREVQHLGFLVHELRNALSSATMAHEMISQGKVGTNGSTARILTANLIRMRNLMDRSLSEVRMRADPTVFIENFRLNLLIDQILLTATSEAKTKEQIITSELAADIVLDTDRQLLLSAIANIIQNALKYTKFGGHIVVRAVSSASRIAIEIEDQGGGIEPDVLKTIFKPFTSAGFDQSGMGLGLTIVRRAVLLLQGEVSARSLPGIGCVFKIDIPKKISSLPASEIPPGKEALQPKD